MSKIKNYGDYLILESAPRLPNDVNYWLKKGKSGKDVCLIFHDDLDGITSAILMKNYLKKHGFNIKKYGIINYQEGWTAFKIDSRLITIALDFAEDIPGVDVYIDHHGKFSEEVKMTQKAHSIKTPTGSAAEGIAQQLGMPFSKDTKDWIDMIDSAKYTDYEIDIKGILTFDLKQMTKSSKSKLTFAAAMNQLLKRSDHKTFIEVVNSCEYPSIFNIYRLFKIFYPKNNPDFRTGDEPGFVEDARVRLATMQQRTRGTGKTEQGFDEDGKKIRYMSQQDFWNDFARNLPFKDTDKDGNPIADTPENQKWQLKPGVYQLIGNLMYVPSGTWANALRAKAIYNKDLEDGIVPDDPKLNFVLLQYGNTLQVADISTKIKDMNKEDLPKTKDGTPIDNLGKYCEELVKNFEKFLGYQDERTVAGGHWGIGSISNIFGKCNVKGYEGVSFLDIFKNKLINDISGVKWGLTMPWNEEEDFNKTFAPDEANKKLMNIEDVRSEEEANNEKTEREILNYIVVNFIGLYGEKKDLGAKFKDETMRKIYEIWRSTQFDELVNGAVQLKEIQGLYFKHNKPIEDSEIFAKIVKSFDLNDIYSTDATKKRGNQRKELKRIFKIMYNMIDEKYLKPDTESKFQIWSRKKQ
jgi:hypothetical protein